MSTSMCSPRDYSKYQMTILQQNSAKHSILQNIFFHKPVILNNFVGLFVCLLENIPEYFNHVAIGSPRPFRRRLRTTCSSCATEKGEVIRFGLHSWGTAANLRQTVIEQGGSFIMPLLLGHETYVSAISSHKSPLRSSNDIEDLF